MMNKQELINLINEKYKFAEYNLKSLESNKEQMEEDGVNYLVEYAFAKGKKNSLENLLNDIKKIENKKKTPEEEVEDYMDEFNYRLNHYEIELDPRQKEMVETLYAITQPEYKKIKALASMQSDAKKYGLTLEEYAKELLEFKRLHDKVIVG